MTDDDPAVQWERFNEESNIESPNTDFGVLYRVFTTSNIPFRSFENWIVRVRTVEESDFIERVKNTFPVRVRVERAPRGAPSLEAVKSVGGERLVSTDPSFRRLEHSADHLYTLLERPIMTSDRALITRLLQAGCPLYGSDEAPNDFMGHPVYKGRDEYLGRPNCDSFFWIDGVRSGFGWVCISRALAREARGASESTRVQFSRSKRGSRGSRGGAKRGSRSKRGSRRMR